MAVSFDLIVNQVRTIKTRDVREYKPMGMTREMRYYQRYTTNPMRRAGVIFLTHFSSFRRYDVRSNFIDYLHWGKEQGQAKLPHRHQRVAFDFNDSLHPTRLQPGRKEGWFEGQDPSYITNGFEGSLVTKFNPNFQPFSFPEHMSREYTQYWPDEFKIKLSNSYVPSYSISQEYHDISTVEDPVTFGIEGTISDAPPGRIPGLNAPFRGEPDRLMMQAMSAPLVSNNSITANDGRFSKILYINVPQRDNIISAHLANALEEEIDAATNAVYSKLVVLTAAQSGETDAFCAGADYKQIAYDIYMAEKHAADAATISRELEKLQSSRGGTASSLEVESLERRIADDTDFAKRYRIRADETLRSYLALLWRVFTAARPLMTIINGCCRNVGCGVALLSRFPALRDSSELIFDGPHLGVTPFGGLTALLARRETAGKLPGVAEYVMLTGNALYAGDALRLGWSRYFSSLDDICYHIREYFNNTEHMHNDAIAWQLGHLLETCFLPKGDMYTGVMERLSITPTRARWIEDAFADQPSVEAIVETLTQMEHLPCTDQHNNSDLVALEPHSLSSVEGAVQKLRSANLHFALAPWEMCKPASGGSEDGISNKSEDDLLDNTLAREKRNIFAEVFTSYLFQTDSRGVPVAVHRNSESLRVWREQRYKEYKEFIAQLNTPVMRDCFVRIELCGGKLLHFTYCFDRISAVKDVAELEQDEGRAVGALSAVDSAMLSQFVGRIRKEAGWDLARPIELSWCLPTLDTCQIRNDEELQSVLQNDPGLEAPAEIQCKYSPVYFSVRPLTILMSEWAFSVKHQILLQSPFALKAAFQLLSDVRCGARNDEPREKSKGITGSTRSSLGLADTLAVEFRYISRLVQRPDFYRIGVNSQRTPNEWRDINENKATTVGADEASLGATASYEEVFERDCTVAGHYFVLRPRWSPRTLEEVSLEEVASLSRPLSFTEDCGVTEVHVPTFTNKRYRVASSINDLGGYEVVPGLGEADSGVQPLQSDAHVPKNVNFYEMARHPWLEHQTSLRLDSYTDASMKYMESKVKKAEEQLYYGDVDEVARQRGMLKRNYWPRDENNSSVADEEKEQNLIKERLYDVLDAAGERMEPWAKSLDSALRENRTEYPEELLTVDERMYDDEFYRWYIHPGEHPNPSGLINEGKRVVMPKQSAGDHSTISPEQLMEIFEEGASSDSGSEVEFSHDEEKSANIAGRDEA